MNFAIFVLAVGAIYLMKRFLLALLIQELRTRLHDSYRFVGPLVAPLHLVLLLASVLIGMSLVGVHTGQFVLPFYFAIAWFVFRVITVVVFEWWLVTIKGVRLPGVARRLISIALGFAAVLAFVRIRLDVRSDDIAIVAVVVGLIVVFFFHRSLRDLFLGISMAVEQRIRVGEWVSIDGHAGQVVAVDWKTTTLQNERLERIVVPNRQIAETIVRHLGHATRRHAQVAISLPADAPPSVVLQELASAVADAPDVLSDPPPKTYYCGERAGEGRFEASFWLPDKVDSSAVESDVQVAIWYRLRRRGLIGSRSAFDLDQVRHALRQLPFLASAAPLQIDRLAQNVRTARFGKGEILFRQHDRGDELFLIQSGAFDISVVNGHKAGEKIASVGAGSFVGERSVLTGEPRSATARAAEDTIVFVVDRCAMGELLHDDPALAHEIALVMTRRDAQRDRLTRDMTNGRAGESAHSFLQRIRSCFALA